MAEYYFTIKKELNNAICSKMDGPRDCHAEWSQTKKDKHHMVLLLHGSLFASHIITCEEHFLQPSVSCCVRRQPRLLATSPTVFQASPVLRLELSPAFPRLAFFLGSPQMKPLLGRACWPLLLQATLHSLYWVCGLLTWSLEQARTAALMWPRSAPTLRKHLCVNPQCLALRLPHQICFLS